MLTKALDRLVSGEYNQQCASARLLKAITAIWHRAIGSMRL